MTVALDRDYDTELAALVDARLADKTDVVAAALAADLLTTADPGLIDGWLRAHRAAILTSFIRHRANSFRSQQRHRALSKAFGEAAAGFANGDTEAMGSFEARYIVDEQETRRRVADMTGADHRFVAHSYEETAKGARMLAAFHRAVAKRCGARCTGDVFSEEEYDALLASLTGRR